MSWHGLTGSRSRNAPFDGMIVGVVDVSAVIGVHGRQPPTAWKSSMASTTGNGFVLPAARMVRQPAPPEPVRFVSVVLMIGVGLGDRASSQTYRSRLLPWMVNRRPMRLAAL